MEKRKNCWVIPTDKPSKLFIHNAFNDLRFDIRELKHDNNQNIYITFDEEIKEKTLIFCSKENRVIVNQYHTNIPITYKKIILTTDPQLIADGVQAIDDKFLEWFVMNPSCEFVEVDCWTIRTKDKVVYEPPLKDYKIIIPQEEPKQETLEEVAENSLYSQEYLNKEERIIFKKGCVYGAKWQAERMYSEEEVEQICIGMVNWAIDNIDNINAQSGKKFDKIIEQFKKK